MAHAAADQHWLADRGQIGRQIRVAAAKGACCALAVHEQAALLAVRLVPLFFAGIVRDIEQQPQRDPREEASEDAARQMAYSAASRVGPRPRPPIPAPCVKLSACGIILLLELFTARSRG